MAPSSLKIFISYTASDVSWAKWVDFHLRKHGFQTSMQLYDFDVGSNFILEMDAASDNTKTIALLSPDYLKSKFCKAEWAAALRRDPDGTARKLIPLRVRQCDVEGILGSVVYADLVGVCEDDVALRTLLNAIEGTTRPTEDPGLPSILSQGDLTGQEHERFPGRLPPIWNIPHHRNPHFTGRDTILEGLRDLLTSGNPTALTQALSGLGGVGKTQLAVEYCYRHATDYTCIWWIRSEDPATLAADYTALAVELQLPESHNRDERQVIQAVRRALENRNEWLLIFDNVEEHDSLLGYLPQGPQRQVIITSRKRNWSGIATPVDISTFERSESIEFFAKRTDEEDEETADKLADELGDLPLALEQAAAYIKEAGPDYGYEDYLSLYKEATQELLAQGVLSSAEYPGSVITTWKTTIRKLSPPARAILRLSGFLAPEPIPIPMFVTGAESVRAQSNQFESTRDTKGKSTTSGEFYIRNAVNELTRYSMVTSYGYSFSVHRLVQTVERVCTHTEFRSNWIEIAIKILLEYAPKQSNLPRTWPVWDTLYPHASALDDRAACAPPEVQISLLDELARFNFGKERYEVSLVKEDRAFRLSEKTYGPDALETEDRLINYGESLRGVGKFSEAEKLFSRSKAWREAHHGHDSKSVATSLNYLGFLMRDQEKFTEAEAYLEEGLAICDRIGITSGTTYVKLLFNMAAVALEGERFDEAEPLFRKVLAITSEDIESYGHLHYWNIQALGALLNNAGNPTAALPLMREATAKLESLFGLDHPNSLNSIGILSKVLQNCGKYPEAEQLCRQQIEIAMRIGKESIVRAAQIHLAELLMQQGQLDEQVLNYFSNALEQSEEDKGENHPDTIVYLEKYAKALDAMERLEDAEVQYRRSLDISENVLGKDHPDTATSIDNLAGLFESKGDHEGAERLYRRVLDIRERVLGEDHLDTATSLSNLAASLSNKGDYKDAEPLYRRLLDIRERVLGEDHPDTTSSIDNLAGLLRCRGDYEDAEPLYRRLLDIRERVLGEDHSDTAFTMHQLAFCLDKTDKHSKAEILYKKALEIWEKEYGNDHVEPINCKLNLQICLYRQNSREFDLDELKTCAVWLKDKNDPRADKGLTVLRALGKKL